MRRLLYIIIGLAALTVWSCGKDNAETGTGEPSAPVEITLSKASFDLDRTAQTITFDITAPSRPSVSADADWLKASVGIFNNYKTTCTLTVEANGTYDVREAVLSITSGSLKKSVTVKQAGREKPQIIETDIAKSPVTENPTPEAVALYNYLLENYGKKTISSIMANVNWNNDEAEKVYKAVGKYPAMNCYDFIHILYSGANWINYSDITPVKNWHDAGGIVSLMWHFNVPKSQIDGTSEVTCTPSETTFRATNALTEGTWENKWFYDQMEKVADVILKLQDAGIAAIWRPFHEAAGNYYALEWHGTSWFWWGFDGPEVYKRLWNAMWDYFKERGIRNLIWVWTAQDYNGDPSKYDSDAPFYPGDDRVDVVARDIYGKGADVNLNDFVSAQNGYPHKMIALGECGKDNGTDYGLISDIWEAGATWSWFMVWYGANMEGAGWWKDALENENVITRDQVSIE